ncbi:sirohydrochlorin ferrochelatase [Paenibacillus phyllosphaerae]|uniref:Sirohydrochlorin ferrochelatase n=1 Tax=Paenibacillus phyllosphaerae TaxID=274593 RepID=A0A7W5B1G4_9BACL|nr:CbiX/SirB N-terminal domain-containing protein [Paenibacillus phyllosphaerae]MBB3111951.1 sirohydrochlorin ferrochelatase [Paenibacillus phyllosphaerae]
MQKPGILVISHGSRDEGWVALVDDAVAQVSASLNAEVQVVSAFLEIVEGRLIQDGIDQLEAEGVTELFVLPLFVSSGSTHVDDIAQGFGLPRVREDREGELGVFRVGRQVNVTFGSPIDDHEDIAQVLLDNIRELSESPERESLLLIAHGSNEEVFHERYRDGMQLLAERLRRLGGFAGADYAMLLPDQAAAKLRALQEERPEQAWIVVPLFLSQGYFTQKMIPSRLTGLTYRYNGQAMLPHPRLLAWMEHQMAAFVQQRDEG